MVIGRSLSQCHEGLDEVRVSFFGRAGSCAMFWQNELQVFVCFFVCLLLCVCSLAKQKFSLSLLCASVFLGWVNLQSFHSHHM